MSLPEVPTRALKVRKKRGKIMLIVEVLNEEDLFDPKKPGSFTKEEWVEFLNARTDADEDKDLGRWKR